MDNPYFPIAIVGAGASGLMAAVAASRARPRAVLLLEKEARAGRKLMATGNGRCNLLNMEAQERRYHGTGAGAAGALLAQTPPDALLALFASLGLHCREEGEGRVYPYSGQAGAVLDVLRMACDRQGVQTRCGAEVLRVARVGDGFEIALSGGETYQAGRLIAAGGGMAAPSLGGGDSAYGLLRGLGHTVTRLHPALAPLKLPADSIRGLKGVRCPGEIRLLADGKPLRAERGELLFADYGISGVAAMQLAREAGEALVARRNVQASIGLVDAETARAQAEARASLFAGEPLESFFTGLLHRRVGLCLLREAGLAPQAPVTREAALALAPLLSDWRLPVLGTLSFAQAQCTAGGVPLTEFDPATLASRRTPGLYACGEVLDVDGDCGGYNLMWAWVSGWTAGGSAAAGI